MSTTEARSPLGRLAQLLAISNETEADRALDEAVDGLDDEERRAIALALAPELGAEPELAEPTGPFSAEQVAALRGPLDPKRIKKKPGRNVDYLAEHDVIRRANEIFGFGNWGTAVVWHELLEGAPAKVKNGKGEDGWYVGYRCCVRLTIVDGAAAMCPPIDGVGYGDAFETQWSAVITAHELAAKEAESDAIKRAFKKLGDQFGLVLYAKGDERREIEQAAIKEAAEQKDPVAAAKADLRAKMAKPTTWGEMGEMFAEQAGQSLGPWIAGIIDALYPGNAKVTDLTADQQKELAPMLQEVCLDVAVEGPGPGAVPPIADEAIQRIIFERCGVPVKIPAVATPPAGE